MSGLNPETLELAAELELLFMEPREVYDSCIVGVAQRFNDYFLVYSKTKVLARIIEGSPGAEDPETDANEYFDFNVVGGWFGEGTAAYLLDDR